MTSPQLGQSVVVSVVVTKFSEIIDYYYYLVMGVLNSGMSVGITKCIHYLLIALSPTHNDDMYTDKTRVYEASSVSLA